MEVLDPHRGRLAHSGTFNGNPVTCAAGVVSVRELTSDRIGVLDAWGATLQDGLERAAGDVGLPFSTRRVGSLLQCYLSDVAPRPGPGRDDAERMARFHLAALNHGLFFAARGLVVLSTAFDDGLVDEVVERAAAALADVAAET
jgi:glutamate-1-semialdehyde 2,1-aminomutase